MNSYRVVLATEQGQFGPVWISADSPSEAAENSVSQGALYLPSEAPSILLVECDSGVIFKFEVIRK